MSTGIPPYQASQPMAPPSQVSPTKVDTLPHQVASKPGDGSQVYTNTNDKAPDQVADTVPFKEQVIGYAQITRGKVLNKPELKEHGEKILAGEATHGA